MLQSLFRFSISPLELVIRSAIVYLVVLILLRAGGKKQIGQMGATEFVAVLLISNAVQNAMNGGDNSLAGGLVLAGVLVFLSSAISFLTFRSRKIAAIFEGTPTLLVHASKPIPKHLRKEQLTENDLKILLRKQGIHSLEEVQTAVLEADGSLSVTRKEEAKG
ncbi:MAG: DUF421 domain-containing protein [Bdellovibrionota bacterium]